MVTLVKHIGNIKEVEGKAVVEESFPTWEPVQGKINLVWDQCLKLKAEVPSSRLFMALMYYP